MLSSRVGALQRKLATETKIRDAAQNLARLNSSSSSAPSSSTRISRQSSTALETAERKVDTAQTELWRVQERAANVSRRLLEHRAGILATALEAAERTQADEEQDNNIDGPLSPVSTGSGAGALAQKFDGAHLFAGHEGAVMPARLQARGAQRKELEDLQARLDASEDRARRREAELEDARAAAEAELEDARAAADARAALESELEQEHAALEQERKRATELEGRLAFLELEVESSARGSDTTVRLEERVRALERELSEAVNEVERVRTGAEGEAEAWATEKVTWAAERARFEQEEARWAQLADGIENERSRWEQEREELAAQAKDQIATAADGLRALVQQFDVPLFSRESGLGVPVDALRRHLEKQTQSAQESELLLAAEVEKRAAVSSELETAKGEIQTLQAISVSVLRFIHPLRSPRNVQMVAPRRAAVPSQRTPRNRGLPLRLPLRRTPRASWRSCSPSGRRSRLQKRAQHGSAVPPGPSAQAAGGRRPACARVPQAAPVRTCQSATWMCARSRASTRPEAEAPMATAMAAVLLPRCPTRAREHLARRARQWSISQARLASRRSRCACRRSSRTTVR